MRFSKRTAWEPGADAWAEAAAETQRSRRSLVDLTVSNPTRCGLGPTAAEVLGPLSAPGALSYTPDPLGMLTAREAVTTYYADAGCEVPPDRICMTTSTSEAYSFLFRLLCNPGDEVLIARPSYPLFDLLAGLDDVVLREYPLLYEPGLAHADEGGWSIDFTALEGAITERTRAIVVVHPNNPTGHYTTMAERQALVALCADLGLSLIVDEVFLDYRIGPQRQSEAHGTFGSVDGCLCFVLSGLSKVCALPQMKASWIVAKGPAEATGEAMRRLEIIADTFLSMNAPVQFALPFWLRGRHSTQALIRTRLADNLAVLDQRLGGSLSSRLAMEGGWTVVLRVPRHIGEDAFALAALRQGVLVQPGTLYGLPEGRCVLSLLTEPQAWQRGLELLPL